MFHIIGISMILVALLATAVAAGVGVFRVRDLATAFSRLRRHPMFEPEWRERQTQTIRRIEAGTARLREDLAILSTTVAQLIIAAKELGDVVRGTSRPIDLVLRLGLPWLAGLLGPQTRE